MLIRGQFETWGLDTWFAKQRVIVYRWEAICLLPICCLSVVFLQPSIVCPLSFPLPLLPLPAVPLFCRCQSFCSSCSFRPVPPVPFCYRLVLFVCSYVLRRCRSVRCRSCCSLSVSLCCSVYLRRCASASVSSSYNSDIIDNQLQNLMCFQRLLRRTAEAEASLFHSNQSFLIERKGATYVFTNF